MPSSAQKNQTRRAQPVIEGLEERQLLSRMALHQSAAAASFGGTLSHNGTEFAYTTPSGGHASVQVVGLGNLAGTSVNSAGALQLVYGGTNAYSKIIRHVTGGSGHAPLASILNAQLNAADATNSISGVGGNVIESVYLPKFDLVAGGNINLTSGVNTLVLDAVGADTQIHLRELPPAPSTSTSTASVATLELVSTTGVSSSASLRSINTNSTPESSSSTSSSSANTLEAGQSTSVTNEGVTTTYKANADGGQTLTGISGTFTPGANIVESLPAGQPPQTVPPAPPGVIVKITSVAGKTPGAVNLLTDPKIFGYDPTTGQVVRFNVDLSTRTAVQDSTFTPINVPGDPASAGLNLGYNGDQLDVLVSSGTTVYAYDATTGAAEGSFTASEPINAIGSTETVTALGTDATNELQLINLKTSLQTGIAQPAPGSPAVFTPASGFTLLGGLTGVPGSTSLTTSVGAIFDTYTPNQPVLGLQPINTVSIKGTTLNYDFSAGSATGLTQGGAFVPVQTNPAIPTQTGAALGSIDQSLALVTGASNGTNSVASSYGTITFTYGDRLTALSEAFRPDLAAAALIDIQGDVQSVRGSTANGLVLNDNGNLNLVQFTSVTNSTIVGQPLSHLNIKKRSNVIAITPSRTVGARNGVTLDSSIEPIGPLTQINE